LLCVLSLPHARFGSWYRGAKMQVRSMYNSAEVYTHSVILFGAESEKLAALSLRSWHNS
jgi:hypothetical protein